MDLLEGLTQEEKKLAKSIFNSRTGQLRASRPKLAKKVQIEDSTAMFGAKWVYQTDKERQQAKTAYIWRMVAFFISANSQHQCMPCTANFWLEGTAQEAREMAKELDKIVDKIVSNIPPQQQYGTIRWGRVLGHF